MYLGSSVHHRANWRSVDNNSMSQGNRTPQQKAAFSGVVMRAATDFGIRVAENEMILLVRLESTSHRGQVMGGSRSIFSAVGRSSS
jgi:hypothetical protein